MSETRVFPIGNCPHDVQRQVLGENPDLTVVFFSFPEGGKGDLYNHAHTQATYVESGRFTFIVGDDFFEVSTGDNFVIPSNPARGCICREAGRLIDSFSPRRDNFL